MRRVLLAGVAAAFLLGMAGCGESPRVTVFKQGEYRGKPYTEPWRNDLFKGDKVAWEKAIRSRTSGQNEYVRGAPMAN